MALKRVVVDTSALISLARADFLEYPITNFDLVVPPSVIEEVEALRKKPETKAAANRVLEVKSKLTLIKPRENATGQDSGEKDCFSICMDRGIKLFVLDDFRAIRRMKPAATSRRIELSLSVFFIAHCAGGEKISKDTAFNLFDRMAEQRDWLGSRVYKAGKELLERELKKFK